jgi:hypothetical protein
MSATTSDEGEVETFPIVGMGASAGGLGAFEKFWVAAGVAKRCARKIPALLLSADTLPASVHEMGASGYWVLQKPVEVEQLVAQLNQLLDV